MKLALPVFPCESVAVQATVVVPIGKVLPEAGAHVSEATASSGSLAEAEYVTTAPLADVAFTVIGADANRRRRAVERNQCDVIDVLSHG